MSLFFLELERWQVQPLHPGTRVGQSAGGTEFFLLKCPYKQPHQVLHFFVAHICKKGTSFCTQKISHNRVSQLRELQSIIEEISRAIMWVNEKEEEELMFDWGDKNIDQYIPRKQESYSVSLNSYSAGCFSFDSGLWLYL